MRVQRLMIVPAVTLVFAGLIGATGAGCSRGEVQETVQEPSKSPDLFTQPVKTEQPDMQMPIAVVNGKTITRGQVEVQAGRMIQRLAGQRVPQEQIMQMRERILDQAVDQLVVESLLLEAIEAEQIQAPPEEMENAWSAAVASVPDEMTLEQALEQNGMTEQQFRERLEKEVRIATLLKAKTEDESTIEDSEVSEFYEKNKERFVARESVNARHILVSVDENDTDEQKAEKKARIEDIKAKLAEGADFSALASEHSDCPSKNSGGKLGPFQRGDMVKPFEDAAFTQEVGVVGDVVETRFGYHLVLVDERSPEHEIPFDEAKERIEQRLKMQKQQQALIKYVEELKEKADISYPQQAAAKAAAAESSTPPAPPAPPAE